MHFSALTCTVKKVVRAVFYTEEVYWVKDNEAETTEEHDQFSTDTDWSGERDLGETSNRKMWWRRIPFKQDSPAGDAGNVRRAAPNDSITLNLNAQFKIAHWRVDGPFADNALDLYACNLLRSLPCSPFPSIPAIRHLLLRPWQPPLPTHGLKRGQAPERHPSPPPSPPSPPTPARPRRPPTPLTAPLYPARLCPSRTSPRPPRTHPITPPRSSTTTPRTTFPVVTGVATCTRHAPAPAVPPHRTHPDDAHCGYDGHSHAQYAPQPFPIAHGGYVPYPLPGTILSAPMAPPQGGGGAGVIQTVLAIRERFQSLHHGHEYVKKEDCATNAASSSAHTRVPAKGSSPHKRGSLLHPPPGLGPAPTPPPPPRPPITAPLIPIPRLAPKGLQNGSASHSGTPNAESEPEAVWCGLAALGVEGWEKGVGGARAQ
ncbi:hypothetical protein B0H13DRAFT_2326012 [Mycena leptocephala]|nr:hypothetical protein B0H13DRAFT_2326012 [Mycena leptocephala]